MTKQDYTYDELHELFYNYLIEKIGDEERVTAIQQMAEDKVPGFLKEYFGTEFLFVYELRDEQTIEDFIKMIKLHPISKNIDMREDPRYTEALTWYRRFVKSLAADGGLMLVPGENSKVAEKPPHQPVVRKTVFVEGESEESQPKEICLRNQELRQACIDHFKALHGGHVVCECCGFDFSIAYGISDEYIEVHHLTPFHETEGVHEVNAETDLVPLCANCHRMIHHLKSGRGTCVSLEELRKAYRGKIYVNE